MRLSTIAAIGAGIFAIAASAGAANAAPLGGLAKGPAPAIESGVIKVHGRHRACRLGPAGWHRTLGGGYRVACRPPRPRGAYWMWRNDGPRHGWYHSRERRWWR